MTEKRIPDYRGGTSGFRAAAEALKLPQRRPTDKDRPRLRPFPGRRVKPLPGQLSLEAELERAAETAAKGPLVTAYAGRLVVYDREMHLESLPGETFVAGDVVEVIRGNGPREGGRMGTAIVTGLDPDCGPDLLVRFEGEEWGEEWVDA